MWALHLYKIHILFPLFLLLGFIIATHHRLLDLVVFIYHPNYHTSQNLNHHYPHKQNFEISIATTTFHSTFTMDPYIHSLRPHKLRYLHVLSIIFQHLPISTSPPLHSNTFLTNQAIPSSCNPPSSNPPSLHLIYRFISPSDAKGTSLLFAVFPFRRYPAKLPPP